MTRAETIVTLALYTGICLVLFYGSGLAILGAVLLSATMCIMFVSSMAKTMHDRINAARREGFEIGKKSIKPYISEHASHSPTALQHHGRLYRVGRDC